MTEEEVVDTIEKVARKLARKFIFGYHTFEDIKQQAVYEGIKGLENYDEIRPLENFLSVHVKNRLCNFKRDNYVRKDAPCSKCKKYSKKDKKCKKFQEFTDCDIYNMWLGKNESRRNIMNPINIYRTTDVNERNMKVHEDPVGETSHNELVDLIDANIPLLLRPDWLKLKNSVRISKVQRTKVVDAITIIFQENDINVSENWPVIG